jgi:hypothetical protein
MCYREGDRVIVDMRCIKSIAGLTDQKETTGKILQRCGAGVYDILLDWPLSPEITIFAWVKGEALRPADADALTGDSRAASPAERAGREPDIPANPSAA